MVQGVAPTAAMAEEVCMTGTRQLFYARLPDVKGTAGGVAFPLDEVLQRPGRVSLDAQPHARRRRPVGAVSVHMVDRGGYERITINRYRPLKDLAKTIRSKNAGVDKITFDVIFTDRTAYELVRRSRALTRKSVASLFKIPEAGFRISSNSIPPARSSSLSCANARAEARVTLTSSARSNTLRCSTSRSISRPE